MSSRATLCTRGRGYRGVNTLTTDPADLQALTELWKDSDPTSDVTLTRNGTRPGREDLPEHAYTLVVSRVEKIVNPTQWVMDIHEWSGDDIPGLVSRVKEMDTPACACARCQTDLVTRDMR